MTVDDLFNGFVMPSLRNSGQLSKQKKFWYFEEHQLVFFVIYKTIKIDFLVNDEYIALSTIIFFNSGSNHVYGSELWEYFQYKCHSRYTFPKRS